MGAKKILTFGFASGKPEYTALIDAIKDERDRARCIDHPSGTLGKGSGNEDVCVYTYDKEGKPAPNVRVKFVRPGRFRVSEGEGESEEVEV